MAGELTADHEQYFRSVFEEFDGDGDGVMTKEELRLLMAALGENLNEAMIEELVSQIDQDSNGTVDCEEFLHLMQMYASLTQHNEAR
jgi:Ca2+-binding EF-hand superfamily protein